jgi:hypothetical protein
MNTKRLAGLTGLLAAGGVVGAIAANAITASAAGSTTTTPPTTTSAAPAAPAPRPGGAAPVRPDETRLTGTAAANAKAAALAAVPGGTVYRVETDAGDGVYEAHMTKADGTLVTVKLDKNFKVTAVEAGMGRGDPRPAGAPAQPQSNSSA